MTYTRTSRRTPRDGFTLIELLVVVAIIAVLLALTATAVFRVLFSQTAGATRTTLKKLDTALIQQHEAAVDAARDTFRAQGASVFGDNSDKNQQAYLREVLTIEFPVSFAEVNNAQAHVPTKSSYRQGIALAPSAAGNPNLEGAVCLYLALTQGRRGMTFNLEEAVGNSSIRQIDNAKVVVDSWGTPVRMGRVGNNPLTPAIVSAGPDKKFGTADDIWSDTLRDTSSK